MTHHALGPRLLPTHEHLLASAIENTHDNDRVRPRVSIIVKSLAVKIVASVNGESQGWGIVQDKVHSRRRTRLATRFTVPVPSLTHK